MSIIDITPHTWALTEDGDEPDTDEVWDDEPDVDEDQGFERRREDLAWPA